MKRIFFVEKRLAKRTHIGYVKYELSAQLAVKTSIVVETVAKFLFYFLVAVLVDLAVRISSSNGVLVSSSS